MHTFLIPVYWEVSADIEVEADSLEEAYQKANEVALPEGNYIDGSFEINREYAEELNKAPLEIIRVEKAEDKDLPLLINQLETEKGRNALKHRFKSVGGKDG